MRTVSQDGAMYSLQLQDDSFVGSSGCGGVQFLHDFPHAGSFLMAVVNQTENASEIFAENSTSTLTFTSTRFTFPLTTAAVSATTTWGPITLPYCLCEANASGVLQCETGAGQVCLNTTDLSGCFEDGSLCEASDGCLTKPEFVADCAVHDPAACQEQAACYYQAPSLAFMMACRGRGVNKDNANAQAVCAEYADKEACHKQTICQWTLIQQEVEQCQNGGVYVGCVGVVEQLDERCAIHRNEASCQLESDICQWQGLCRCTDEFFGDSCHLERAEFHLHGGLCVQSISQPSVCKGLVMAASLQDRQWCGIEQDCTDWVDVKYMLGMMHEAEIGKIIVDACSVVFCGLAIFLKQNGEPRKHILFFTLLSFTADIALGALLVHSATRAREAVAQFHSAFCVSQAGGVAAWMLLSNLASSIATLAWVNLFLALVGGLSAVLFIRFDRVGKNMSKAAVLPLIILASLTEFLVGLFGLAFNTGEFIATFITIEMAALGLQPAEGWHMCYVRNPNLPAAEAPALMSIQPGLTILMPSLLVLLGFLSAMVTSFCLCLCIV